MATAFPGWEIDAIDGSAAMLRYGCEAVASKGLVDRIRLIEAYLPDCDELRPGFDLVFSNSLLHHLRDLSVLWQCVQRWAQPGCAVLVDLKRPESCDEAHRLVQHYSGAEPEVLRRDFYNSLLAAYTVDEVRRRLRQAMLPQQTEAVTDRHLIVWGRAEFSVESGSRADESGVSFVARGVYASPPTDERSDERSIDRLWGVL